MDMDIEVEIEVTMEMEMGDGGLEGVTFLNDDFSVSYFIFIIFIHIVNINHYYCYYYCSKRGYLYAYLELQPWNP